MLYCILTGIHKWMEVDSNHRSILQQIYSLSPLATRESIHILHSHILTKKYCITNTHKMQEKFASLLTFVRANGNSPLRRATRTKSSPIKYQRQYHPCDPACRPCTPNAHCTKRLCKSNSQNHPQHQIRKGCRHKPPHQCPSPKHTVRG